MIKEPELSIAIECNYKQITHLIDRYNQLSTVAKRFKLYLMFIDKLIN